MCMHTYTRAGLALQHVAVEGLGGGGAALDEQRLVLVRSAA